MSKKVRPQFAWKCSECALLLKRSTHEWNKIHGFHRTFQGWKMLGSFNRGTKIP